MSSELFGDDISKLWPISYEGQSDTACFDNALEFLVMGGYSLPHAAMMLIPEAWAGNPLMDDERKAFYEYYAALMEPWDGPALIAFTDGSVIGAVLDRNGLRPGRYWVTSDGLVVLASEVGVLDIDPSQIVRKGRLQPGKVFLVDTAAGRGSSSCRSRQASAIRCSERCNRSSPPSTSTSSRIRKAASIASCFARRRWSRRCAPR